MVAYSVTSTNRT